MKSIYFDFSHISRNTKVTGIPRVSYEYFKRFMQISEGRGGDYIRTSGIYGRCRSFKKLHSQHA